MIETRYHEHALLAEDPGLGAVGEDDAPALETRPHAAAVHDWRPGGGGRQLLPHLVAPMCIAELQILRNPVEGDGVDHAVVLPHQRARAVIVATATAPQNLCATVTQLSGEVLVLFSEVYDETAFHLNLLHVMSYHGEPSTARRPGKAASTSGEGPHRLDHCGKSHRDALAVERGADDATRIAGTFAGGIQSANVR